MELVCGQMNNVTLESVHRRSISICSRMLVAVAYADGKNMQIFEDCKARGVRLDFFGRHDYSVPVHPSLLKWFIDAASPNLSCWLVHEYYHPKVIWWLGAGAYIGSANLTPRAWDRNIEVGVFFSEDELSQTDIGPSLFEFFSNLESISTRLRRELWLDQLAQADYLKKKMEGAEADARSRFEQRNRVPKPTLPWLAPAKKSAFQKFEEEWNATIELLRTVGFRVSSAEMRPDWIKEDVPAFVQGDQFLHAYYYKRARRMGRVLELHESNRGDPEGALLGAMAEWKATTSHEASDEARHMHEWAPLVASLCGEQRIRTLTRDEFSTLLQHIHAARDHVSHGPLDFMPAEAADWSIEDRIGSLASFLWEQESECGWHVLDVLHYVAWGADGKDAEPITQRLWRAAKLDAQLRHLGISTLGELVGWARSDRYPPRNGRTSKALLALGNTVNVNLN